MTWPIILMQHALWANNERKHRRVTHFFLRVYTCIWSIFRYCSKLYTWSCISKYKSTRRGTCDCIIWIRTSHIIQIWLYHYVWLWCLYGNCCTRHTVRDSFLVCIILILNIWFITIQQILQCSKVNLLSVSVFTPVPGTFSLRTFFENTGLNLLP